MGNVNLPTPVALAAGVLLLLAGYLLGAVTGPESSTRTAAVVESYDRETGELCLSGEGIEDEPGFDDGELCGTWRRTRDTVDPSEGDEFRFVSLIRHEGGNAPETYIYGDVVG
jgi:hypothetical protein